MRKGATRLRKLLGSIPRFLLLLVRLLGDPRVAPGHKAAVLAAIVYALAPYDLLPDLLPFVGQIDDLFLVALTIDRLMVSAGPDLVRLHWDGPEELLGLLTGSLSDLAERLPASIRRRLAEGTDER